MDNNKDKSDKFNEPAFEHPEVMAAREEQAAGNNQPISYNSNKIKKSPIQKIHSKWNEFDKKQRALVLFVLVAFLAAVGFGLYSALKPKPAPQPAPVVEAPKPEEPPKPTTEASKLSGVQITPELNQRSITGVMIENSPDARPQAGLKDAGVVFEAIAEGGITRFLALFQEGQPDYIGPVRSARPYYIDWLLGFDAAYAHAGGSGEALALIRELGVKDMDHGANGGAFHRVSNRYAPHNLYTSTAALDGVKSQRGYNNSSFTSLSRIEEAAAASPSVTKIDINPSSANYAVHYDYNQSTNSYNRVLAGRPHTDERSGQQLSPKVVVAWVIPYSIHPDRIHSAYKTTSGGQAVIFQNGTATEVTWAKPDRKSQITFKDAAGNPVGLVPGQTWFTAVSSRDRIGFAGP